MMKKRYLVIFAYEGDDNRLLFTNNYEKYLNDEYVTTIFDLEAKVFIIQSDFWNIEEEREEVE